MILNTLLGALILLCANIRETSQDSIIMLKQKIEQNKIDKIEIYLIDWLTLTREAITPETLLKRYDIKMQVRKPYFNNAIIHGWKESNILSTKLLDIRVGILFYQKDRIISRIYFGLSNEVIYFNGSSIKFDTDFVKAFWDYLPFSEREKIEKHFIKFVK